jgi:hypothetical protein
MRKDIKINREQLRRRCIQPETEFFEEGEVVSITRSKGDESFYVFQDNGANILAVAHLDSVITPKENWTFQSAKLGKNGQKRNYIFNPQLDDRLGVYIILDLLPNIIGEKKYDILLTTDEEGGASTAGNFIVPVGKDYNWIFQFDRRGTGAVLYQYENTEWRTIVNEEFAIHIGSYSDICKLEEMGVKALNVGTGYYDEHRDLCYMVVEDTISQVGAFCRFYYNNRDIKYVHTKNAGYRNFRWGNSYDDVDDDYGYSSGRYNIITPSTGSNSAITTVHRDDLNGYNIGSNYNLTADDPRIWSLHPSVSKFEIRMKGCEENISMYIHPTTGRQATECFLCTEVEYFDDVSWTPEGNPICSWCALHPVGTVLTELFFEQPAIVGIINDKTFPQDGDKLVWLTEGGSIKRAGSNWIRVLPRRLTIDPINSRKSVVCQICYEPDWMDTAYMFTNTHGKDVHMCRWCYEASVKNEDEEDTRPIPIHKLTNNQFKDSNHTEDNPF